MFTLLSDNWLPDSCHLFTLEGVKNKDIKDLFHVDVRDYRRKDKYSPQSIVLQHKETGEKLTLYTCYGTWRIGGMAWLKDTTNQTKALNELIAKFVTN